MRYVCAYLDDVTEFSQALELQTREPSLHERQTSLTLFHARSVPTINLETYVSRILKYCPCQNEVFLGLIVYIQQMVDRCARRRVPFTVDAYSIHRLIITGVTIGSKWFSDVFFTNSRYARVGGLTVAELNNLELQFLSIIDFDLNIQPEVLQAIGSDLFAGRLPRLTNVHIYPVDSMYHSDMYTHVPATAYAPVHHSRSTAAHPYHYQQHTYHNVGIPQQQYQQPGFDKKQRIYKHMSYPGPNGVFYSNTYGSVYDKYDDIAAQPGFKQAHHTAVYDANNYDMQDPSSGSTLASSPPVDSVPVAALNQGAA
ncbi:cyclin-like protein interacting with PHO85 [Coemansia umbellata]|nr:cyclin-like protein interacting with PHO85 [Coemansia umbellata]